MNIFDSIILGAVEGLTEFLPVSSTGHLIIVQQLLKISDSDFIKTFQISIQLGAILAVIVFFHKKLKDIEILKKILIGFVPTGILGFLLFKEIRHLLENELLVVFNLILGGILILIIENWYKKNQREEKQTRPINYLEALYLGFFQSLAMIPGVSRSGAIILGGLLMKINREKLVEFTFLLAVPTMIIATSYTIYKDINILTHVENLNNLIVGFVTSFIFATLVIKLFSEYIKKHSFFIFGLYRIVFGIIILYFFI